MACAGRLAAQARRRTPLAAALAVLALAAALLAAASQPAAVQAACAPIPAGNVGWWRLNDPTGSTLVIDVSGQQHHGVPNPSAVAPATQIGGGPAQSWVTPSAVVGGSLFFYRLDGTMFVQVPHHSDLDIDKHSFTIDAWVYPAAYNPDWVLPIVDKFDPAANNGYAFYVQSVGGVDNLLLRFTYGDGTQVTTVTSDPPKLPYTQWTHVAVTVDRLVGGSLDIRLWINGVQQSSAPVFPAPAASIANSLDLLIGGTRIIPSVTGSTALGEIAIDELEIFHAALSPADLQSIVGAGPAGKCHPESLALFEGWGEAASWPGPSLKGVDALIEYLSQHVQPSGWLGVAHFSGGWLQTFAYAPLPAFNTLTAIEPDQDYWLFTAGEAVLTY